MDDILRKFIRMAGLGLAGAATCASIAFADDNGHRRHDRDFDRVFVIMMENHGFDEVIGPLADPNAEGDPEAPLLTPFITNLAFTQGLATFYFGVTLPACRTTSPRSPAISLACRTTTTAASRRR